MIPDKATIADLAHGLREKEFTSLELTDYYLGLIEDDTLNAFISINDKARDTARAADQKISSGEADDLTGARRSLFRSVEQLFESTCTELHGMMVSAQTRMGTTLSVAVMAGSRMIIGHVGDTRVYRFSGGHPTAADYCTLAAAYAQTYREVFHWFSGYC